MGHPPNRRRREARDENILARINRQLAADRLSAALMAPLMPKCACGFTWHDTTLYALQAGWGDPNQYACPACIPGDLRPLLEPSPCASIESPMEHRTTLLAITDLGEVELTTDDPAVMHKARQDHAEGAETRTFVYWNGEEQETVTGRVTWLNEEPTFRFAVMPDEAE